MPTRAVLALASLAALAPGLRADSLWGPGGEMEGRSMYADPKAARPGDIVTIVVQESVAAQGTQSKESTRKSTMSDALGQFVFPGLATHAGSLPAMSTTGTSDYTGGGQVSNSQSLTASAAALVTDVLPNGNLVIEGVRMFTFSGETQYLVLHGIIRPQDISSSNTVQSSNVAEARVEFISQGAINDAEKQGWFSKVYEMLRPF